MERAGGQNVVDDRHRPACGHGEAQPLHGGGLRISKAVAHLHGVDADDLPVLVDQRAAGVAVVQRRRGLEHGHGLAVHGHAAVDGGDDALGQRAPQLHAQRVADGVHGVAHPALIAVAQHGGGQILRVHRLQHRQILGGVEAHQLRLVLPRIGQRHKDGLSVGDHMGVGDDVAVLRQDDAGADAGLLAHLGHHQNGGRVHRGVHLLDGELFLRRVLAVEADGGVDIRPGYGGDVPAEDVHDAAGVLAAVIAAVRRLAASQGGHNGHAQHRAHQHRQHDEEYPQSPAAVGLFLRLGLGYGGRRHGARLHIAVLHLPRPVGAHIPADHLLRLCGRLHRGRSRLRARYRRLFFSVFVLHSRTSRGAQCAICMVNVKAVKPFSLVTVICSLCCARMVLTMYNPSP